VAPGVRGSELLDRALQGRVRFDATAPSAVPQISVGAVPPRPAGCSSPRPIGAASAAERKLITLLRVAGITGGGSSIGWWYKLDFDFRDGAWAVEVTLGRHDDVTAFPKRPSAPNSLCWLAGRCSASLGRPNAAP